MVVLMINSYHNKLGSKKKGEIMSLWKTKYLNNKINEGLKDYKMNYTHDKVDKELKDFEIKLYCSLIFAKILLFIKFKSQTKITCVP